MRTKKASAIIIIIGGALALLAVAVAVAVFMPSRTDVTYDAKLQANSKPPFPIDIFYEKADKPMLDAILIIAPDNFNMPNLAHLFAWYSSDKQGFSIIRVKIYTDRQKATPLDFEGSLSRSHCNFDASFIKYTHNSSNDIDTKIGWFEYRRFLSVPVCSNKVTFK